MESEKSDDPMALVERFCRAGNYPKTAEGVIFLAQGLAKAASATGIDMPDIVDRCAELSGFCPTDHDMLTVAKELAANSQPKAPLGCALCHGSGWQSFQRQSEPIPGKPYMADYAEYCTCERGHWMQSAARQRKQEQDAKRTAKEHRLAKAAQR